MPSAGAHIARQRTQVKRVQYLMLALLVLVSAAILVGYIHGFLVGLPNPVPTG